MESVKRSAQKSGMTTRLDCRRLVSNPVLSLLEIPEKVKSQLVLTLFCLFRLLYRATRLATPPLVRCALLSIQAQEPQPMPSAIAETMPSKADRVHRSHSTNMLATILANIKLSTSPPQCRSKQLGSMLQHGAQNYAFLRAKGDADANLEVCCATEYAMVP